MPLFPSGREKLSARRRTAKDRMSIRLVIAIQALFRQNLSPAKRMIRLIDVAGCALLRGRK
jgi:hypothetical protein